MEQRIETFLAHFLEQSDVNDPYASSHVPIYQTATFNIKKQTTKREYGYTRSESPTREVLDQVFAKAEGGAGAVSTHTGIGAVMLVLETILRAGSHILVEQDLYGGTYRSLQSFQDKYGIVIHYADFTDKSTYETLLKKNDINLVFFETPTNPGLKILDIEHLTTVAHRYGALVAIDNSLATFIAQKPLDYGADISLCSTTKFVAGHGAVTGGIVVCKEESLLEKIQYQANASGRTQSPFDSFLVSLGLATLPIRMKAHEENALLLAQYLENQTWVEQVIFPGLPSHPQYVLAHQQMKYMPGILTCTVTTDSLAKRLVKETKIFSQKFSFGTPDSRISQPALMSHASYSSEDLEKIGLTERTLRLSIGLEHIDDLIADLEGIVNA